jgi:high affinity Mn2+ porin
VDYTGTLGLSVKGEPWHRPGDTFGLAGILDGITPVERESLPVVRPVPYLMLVGSTRCC